MRGWRTKLVTLLFVYFAGFATAIYSLVPGSRDLAEGRGKPESPETFAASVLKSDDFAQRFREGMDKCIKLGRQASGRLAEVLKKELSQKAEG
jgi:hypothetical protein